MTVRVAVIGAGTMGADHIRRLTDHIGGVAIAHIVDADPSRAAALAIPGAHGSTDAFDAIADDDVDAVLVASPGQFHHEHVLACLDARKPVLCEKPLATTAAAALDIVRREQKTGRRLIQVGFMRRFDSEFIALRDTIRSGAIGPTLLLHCAHRNPTVPAHFDNTAVVWDCLVHEIDATRFLLDTEIAAVTVRRPQSSSRARDGLQDPMLVELETVDGRLVDVELFVTAGTYTVRVEAVGESGTATAGFGKSSESFLAHFAGAYRRELQAWVDAVRRGAGGTGPNATDGYAAATVCEAAVRALNSGARTAVATPPDR